MADTSAPTDSLFGKGKGSKMADNFAKGHKKGGSMHKKSPAKSMSKSKK